MELLEQEYQRAFRNKCLLICTIFGLLQALFFYTKKENKLFSYLNNINSKFERKKKQACKILLAELEKVFSVTKLQVLGPYHVQTTMKILNECYKVQFFVFTGNTGKQKLMELYPPKYDDSLIPIYLYMPHSDQTHFIYIKNLNSYFRANYNTCFECKKTYSSIYYRHLCSQRPTCFACRRFFSSESTYLNEKLIKQFCDKLTTNEKEFLCPICNVSLFSQHCYKGHKQLCNGQGHFGYKCTECNKFTYASKDLTSQYIQANHECSNLGICKFCFKFKEEDHICKLSRTKFTKYHNRLAFLVLEVETLCDFSIEPILALIYLEQGQRGKFQKYIISYDDFNSSSMGEEFQFDYFPTSACHTEFADLNIRQKPKITQDYVIALDKLRESNDFKEKIVNFILSSSNTTFVCQDFEGKIMVSTSLTQRIAQFLVLSLSIAHILLNDSQC